MYSFHYFARMILVYTHTYKHVHVAPDAEHIDLEAVFDVYGLSEDAPTEVTIPLMRKVNGVVEREGSLLIEYLFYKVRGPSEPLLAHVIKVVHFYPICRRKGQM